MDEDQIVGWLRRQAETRGLLGDDATLLPGNGPWAVTVDVQRAGIHFPADLDPAHVARRLVAVNLSDLAAVGAAPAYAFLALGMPLDFDYRRFFRALLADCSRQRLTLAGGDLSRSPQPVATLTLLGRLPEGSRWLSRGAARAGDALWLGGTVGESALGCHLVKRGAQWWGNRVSLPEPGLPRRLQSPARRAVRRHLRPSPQLALGGWLARSRLRVAAIDLSDGLAIDLQRLCAESGTGCVVDDDRLPTSERFAELAKELGQAPEDLILGGGEDYVLLFTLPRNQSPPARHACHRVGRLTADRALRLRSPDGSSRPLPPSGWDHFRSRKARGVTDGSSP